VEGEGALEGQGNSSLHGAIYIIGIGRRSTTIKQVGHVV